MQKTKVYSQTPLGYNGNYGYLLSNNGTGYYTHSSKNTTLMERHKQSTLTNMGE